MTEHIASLADLRHEIDVLDDQIQDLLRRRAEAVEKVAITKRAAGMTDGAFLKPGREAQILRRLMARHHGPLPRAAMVRINRELIGALYELQAPVRVAVLAPNKSVARWDIARDHYGSTVPMILCTTASSAMRALSAEPAGVGVMPLPEDGERDPWWPMLANRGADTPRVVGLLPFIPNPRGRLADLGAFLIARCPAEASGEDRSLVALRLAGDAISLDRLGQLLAQADLPGWRVLVQHRDSEPTSRMLLEAPDFIAPDDPRIDALVAAGSGAITDAVVIGAYAMPLSE
ncbi:chorismate mutase [Ferrovibrio sp.]|uniref:chorismate mutase n=1 Tax=Ferrovibrio sp. TaxID=1917215 RepID=UPI0025BDDD22|nr:chorismate mutase [Ferrovibrio sp.]MBX3456062.1 chorismate mutase [Ferrovibrio sp.]